VSNTRFAYLAVAAMAVAACAAPPPAKPDLAAEEQAIRAQDAKWQDAAKAHDAATEASMFADDGVAYRDHSEPLMGPAAYQAYAARDYADNPKEAVSWTTSAIHVAESGDIAMQTGSYEVGGLGPKGSGTDKGSFLTVWKKLGDTWKVAADMSSTSMPDASAMPMKKGG
jgi:uncharacterized protein (TIGR02246 family)